MKKNIIYIWIIIVLSIPNSVQSQCQNINFSMNDFTNWQCYSGTCNGGSNFISPSNPIPGRHTIIDASLLTQTNMRDSFCPNIQKVPYGFSHAVKIGDAVGGAEMEAVEYTMTIDSSNTILLLYFSFVLQAPASHFPSEQPQFKITIKDISGYSLNIPYSDTIIYPTNNLINSSCQQDIAAQGWRTAIYDLRAFIGQTIKIYAEVRDCTLFGHFGYAYLTAQCMPHRQQLSFCNNNTTSMLIYLPSGLAAYNWSRSSDNNWSSNSNRVVITNPIDGEIISCNLLSDFGNTVTLIYDIYIQDIDVDFGFGVMENGNVDLAKNNYQNWYDTCSRTITFVDLSSVNNGNKKSILWEISDLNVSSVDSLFTFAFPNPTTDSMTYKVNLTVEADNGCMDTAGIFITIYPQTTVEITHPNTFLSAKTDTLTAIWEGNISSFRWSWMSEDSSIKTNSIDNPLIISDIGTYKIEIFDINGCFADDSLIISDLKTFFQYGIADENGHVDFAAHNNENWYDSCNRIATFVDLSTLYNTKLKSRTWTIEGVNTIFTDSIFTFQFPNLNYLKTYSIYLTTITENDDIKTYEDLISITPSTLLNIFRSDANLTKLTPITERGKIISCFWSWQSQDGTTKTDTSRILTVTEIGTYFLTIEDNKGCIIKDSIFVDQVIVSLKEKKSTQWTLGQNIPNPANNTTLIPYSIPNDENIEFILYSITGQILHQEIIPSSQGDNQLEYNTSNLSSGIYFYSVTYNNQRLTRKMVIKKI